MANRAATISAVIISAMVAVSLTTITKSTAADECLTAPKADAPGGGHWYYRSDRATKRKCWYISDQREGAERKTASVARSVKPRTSPTLPKSIANARAEIFDAAPDRASAAMPAALPAPASAPTLVAAAAPPAADEWVMAARWADRGDPGPVATSAPVVEAQQPTEPVDEPEDGYSWILMALLAGALAFGGTAIAVIMRRRRARQIEGDKIREPFRMDWNEDDNTEISPVAEPPPDPTMKWVRIAREIQETRNLGREVEELLASSPRRPLA
ncbi:hypothetical protein [Tardiphaga sp.]|uniref:hypothetical protein n=1 Tax=Tardiphaga sp. TaxID=1926292 RepID=UPI0025F558F0|nr:hypothetical protein [Tardiphaga sp.]